MKKLFDLYINSWHWYRKLKQKWCAHKGHPYTTTIIATVTEPPWEREIEVEYCTHCGKELRIIK